MNAADSAVDSRASAGYLRNLFARTIHDVAILAYSENKKENAAQFFTRHPAEVRQFVEEHKDYNIAFGMATREGSKGDKAHCRELTSVFSDADGARFEGFEPNPSVVNASGGDDRYHL